MNEWNSSSSLRGRVHASGSLTACKPAGALCLVHHAHGRRTSASEASEANNEQPNSSSTTPLTSSHYCVAIFRHNDLGLYSP